MYDCGGGPRILSRGEEVKRAFRVRHKIHEPMQNASPWVIESGMYDMLREVSSWSDSFVNHHEVEITEA